MEREFVIQPGQPPWSPTPDSHLLTVHHEYDGPLEGVLEQGEHKFVFRCLFGALSLLQVWAYVPTNAVDERLLDEAEGEEYVALLDRLFASTSPVVALAHAERGLQVSARCEASKGLETLVETAVECLQQRVDELSEEQTALKESVRLSPA